MATATFSQTSPFPPGIDHPPLCTPIMMNAEGIYNGQAGTWSAPPIQNWYVKADGSGPLNIALTVLAAFAPDESGSMTARFFDPAGNPITSQVLVFPPYLSPSVSTALVADPAVPSGIYRLELELGTPSTMRSASHYRLTFTGAEQAAMDSPSLKQFEHDAARWGLNVNPGESLDLTVSGGPIAPAASAEIRLYDPAGTLFLVQPVSDPNSITWSYHLAGAPTGQWTLLVNNANGHYVVDKSTGSDRGIYLTWLTAGEGSLQGTFVYNNQVVNVAGGAAQITRIYPSDPPSSGVGAPVNNGSFSASKLDPGRYQVEVIAPPGYELVDPPSKEVWVLCNQPVTVTFAVRPVAPPPPPPPGSTPGKVTAGTLRVGAGRDRKTAGFVIQYAAGDPAPKGELQFQDHGTSVTFHANEYVRLQISPDRTKAFFEGTGKLNGVPGFKFRARAFDNGEPGTGVDEFGIVIFDANGAEVYNGSQNGLLSGGNVQIHK